LSLEKIQESKGFNDIIWRSRSEISLPQLFSILEDNKKLTDKLRYFRALDFVKSELKNQKLIQLIAGKFKNDLGSQLVALRHLSTSFIQKNKEAKQMVISLLPKTSEIEYLELVAKYEIEEEKNQLLQLILQRKQSRKVGQILFKLNGGADFIQTAFQKQDEKGKSAIIESIRWTGTISSINMLFGIILNENYSLPIRREAASGIGNSSNGEDFVLKILKEKSIPQNFIPSVVESVSKTWRKAIRLEANTYLGSGSNDPSKSNKHPEMNELVKIKGDAKAGVKIFVNQCSMCHQVYNEGIDFGPKLSEIGSKLSKEGLYISVFYPNSGIGFGYETFELMTKTGETYQGIVVSKTETDIALKIPGGTVQNFKTSALKSIKQLPQSLMPEDLANQMSTKDLTDLIEYLSTLKKK
jgi:putative heme-binding domain-containing protein